MALSQIMCLDDNHVNPRTHESKPEFLYCEDQRLALEAFIRDGREAFGKFLEARGLRCFLSDPELEALAGAVEPYDPGSELYPEDAEDDEPPLSLHYWPDLSDTSIPQLDLGWPDCISYRGVTRTNVYAQPPLDGEGHIKEIVRKTIAQAQKVIAVVMDIFTDVDIFRDLLDASFKRKVSVYILLERTALPHFLSMCQRANMHRGHLKNLRVRCAGGADFYARSCTRVRGRMGHRFMFVDGDKAVSGSYSFTWMSSRLEKHHITVVTGQAVDAFDRLFRELYLTSSAVDLRKVATENEPEPEPLRQPAAIVPPSAEVARKLYNPKYALLAIGNSSLSPTSSSGRNSPKDPAPQNPAIPETRKRRRRRASKEAVPEAPPLHPGLVDLEKAYLIPYLPTWPEPDPPSDVIGFINIRDAKRPTQVHLQRSEMFETSQAIRFSSPVNMPDTTLPEVAKPRQLTAKYEEKQEVQSKQVNVKAEVSAADKAQPAQLNTGPFGEKEKAHQSGPNTHTNELKLVNTHTSIHTSTSEPKTGTHREGAEVPVLNTEHNLMSNTPTNQSTSHNTAPHVNAHTPQQLTSDVSKGGSVMKHTVTTNKPEPLPVSKTRNTRQTEPSLNTHSTDTHSSQPLDSKSLQRSHLASSHGPAENDSVAVTSVPSAINLVPSPSISSTPTSSPSRPPITSSSMTLDPPITSVPSSPLPSSSISTPPVPKPRTVQLVIKERGGLDLPEVSVVTRPGSLTSTGPKPANLTVTQTQPGSDPVPQVVKETETVPKLQNESGTKTGVQTGIENNSRKPEGCLATQPTQSVTSQEMERIQRSDHKNRTSMQMDPATKLHNQADVSMASTPQTEHANLKKITPRETETKTSILTEQNITPKPQTDPVTKTEGPKEPQRILNCVLKPQNKGPLASFDSLTPEIGTHSSVSVTHTHERNPISGTHTSKHSVDTSSLDSTLQTHKSTHDTQDEPKQDNTLNTTKHSTHGTLQEPQSANVQGSSQAAKKSLYLHFPDSTTNTAELRSPERDPRSYMPLLRTPTPDRLLLRTPTPDSRTHTPDPRSPTPDFRSPTSDLSDGYLSSREDSTLSNTSEEYFECSDSPLHESVFDRVAYRSHGTTEDHICSMQTNSATTATVTNAANTTPTLSPVYIKTSISAISFGPSDGSTSGNDTQRLPGTSTSSSTGTSSSSLIERTKKMRKVEGETAKENGREVEGEERKSFVEGNWNRTERSSPISQGTESGGSRLSLETKRTANHITEGPGTSEASEVSLALGKDEQARPEAPKRKRAVNLTPAEDLVASGVNKLRELTNEGAETEFKAGQFSSGRERPKEVSSARERAAETAALGPSGVERRDKLQSSRDSEGKKQTPPRPPRWQKQQDSRTSPQSQPTTPPRPARPYSAPQPSAGRPGGGRPLSEARGKSSSPSRPPPRPSPPLAGRRQAEVSPVKHSPPSRPSPAAQGRARAGQTQSQPPYSKPQGYFLHSNLQSQLQPQSQPASSQTQTATQARPGVRQGSAAVAGEAAGQEEGRNPFNLSFGRLYSLRGWKDRMSKPPPQSKTSSTGSAAQTRKSTS